MDRAHPRPRRNSGVTLVELLLTVIVLSILLALAAPSFADVFTKGRLRGAADAASSLLAKARAEAGRSDRNVTVLLQTDASGWCLGARQRAVATVGITSGAGSETCDCLVAPAQCLIGDQNILVLGSEFAGVTVSASSDADFEFDRKQGILSDLQPGSITLAADSNRFQLQVIVSPSGYPRTCVPAGKPQFGGFPPCA